MDIIDSEFKQLSITDKGNYQSILKYLYDVEPNIVCNYKVLDTGLNYTEILVWFNRKHSNTFAEAVSKYNNTKNAFKISYKIEEPYSNYHNASFSMLIKPTKN